MVCDCEEIFLDVIIHLLELSFEEEGVLNFLLLGFDSLFERVILFHQ
jgi:hypothetical protein